LASAPPPPSPAALRRSKKRVHAVITTELPFLLSKEFSSNQENDPYVTKGSALVSPSNATAELHRARWSKLFNQMDSALSEEEKELVSAMEDKVIDHMNSAVYI